MGNGSERARPALILDAGQRQSLVSLRALGRAGIEVWAADWRSGHPASVSRWCAGRARLPDVANHPDAFVDGVIELCEALGSPVIISCHDGSIQALRSRRSEVEQVGNLALASEQALTVAVDKQATLAAAERVKVPTPPTRRVRDISAAVAAIGDLGLPIVVKPRTSWVTCGSGGWGSGPAVGQTQGAAIAEVQRLLDGGVEALLQPWLSGSRDAVGIFLANGVTWARFAVRSQRMYPPIGGNSIVRATIPVPSDIGRMAEALVREISLEGYGEVEFRRDHQGRPFLMEINPRLNAGIEVAVRAGVDIPLLLYRWAAGEPLEPVLEYRAGQRTRWLQGDLRWLAEVFASPTHPDAPRRRDALRTFFGEFARAGSYDYWDSADMRPAIRAVVLDVARIPNLIHRSLMPRATSVMHTYDKPPR